MLLSFNDNDEYSLFYYQENILDDKLLNRLKIWLDEKKFKHGKCISGKKIPRKQLWYQDEKKYFCESWKYRYDRWKSEENDELLDEVKSIINYKVKQILLKNKNIDCNKLNYNSCLINKYENGQDSIKPHRDTAESFGNYPIIAGLSIGCSRIFRIKKIIYDVNNINSQKIDKKENIEENIELNENSLLIMAGASQKYYTHEIPKSNTENIRYSLTFRQYL